MTQREAQLGRRSAHGLTPRQEEVMRLVVRGKTYGEVAKDLDITLDGVKWHMREVLTKFNVNSREEAVAMWRVEHGQGTRLRHLLRGLAPIMGLRTMLAAGAVAMMAGVVIAGAVVAWPTLRRSVPQGGTVPGAPQTIRSWHEIVTVPLSVPLETVENMLAGKLDAMFGAPLSDYQRNILADGKISFDEYRTAEGDWHRCMTNAGVSVPALVLTADGRYNVQYSGADYGITMTAIHNCGDEYTNELEMAWGAAVSATTNQAEYLRDIRIADCIVGRGYPWEAVDSTLGNTAPNRAYSSCAGSVGEDSGG